MKFERLIVRVGTDAYLWMIDQGFRPCARAKALRTFKVPTDVAEEFRQTVR